MNHDFLMAAWVKLTAYKKFIQPALYFFSLFALTLWECLRCGCRMLLTEMTLKSAVLYNILAISVLCVIAERRLISFMLKAMLLRRERLPFGCWKHAFRLSEGMLQYVKTDGYVVLAALICEWILIMQTCRCCSFNICSTSGFCSAKKVCHGFLPLPGFHMWK